MGRRLRLFYLVLVFLIGFASLIYQIYCIRVLFLFFVEHTQAVSISISSFIAGLAVSSLIFSQLSSKKQRNRQLIFYMQLAAAAYGFFFLTNYQLIPQLLDFFYNNIENDFFVSFSKLALMWAYLFIPAFFIGGAFPLINGLYLSDAEMASEETGIVYFWDMMGAITGSLFAGFFLIPYVGIYGTVMVPVVINLFVAVLVSQNKKVDYVLIGVIFLVVANVLFSTAKPLLHERFGTVLFREESPFGTITVGDITTGANNKVKSLFVNFRVMCTSEDQNNLAERALGKVTADNLDSGAHVANIGLGCGFTAKEVAFHENVEHLDVIEINPTVLRAARQEFADITNDVTNSEKVNVIIKDGAEYIRTTDKKYDAVLIDIEEVTVIYSSPLFTKEYYEIIKAHLKPYGVMAHWSFNPNDEFSKIMYNTLAAVFKYVEMRTTVKGDINFYASDRPLNVPVIEDNEENKEIVRKIMENPRQDINTIEEPLLEKYFNTRRVFDLPDDYEEQYLGTDTFYHE